MSYYYVVRGWFETDLLLHYAVTNYLKDHSYDRVPGWAWYDGCVNALSGCILYGGDVSANQIDDFIEEMKTVAQKFPELQGKFCFFGEDGEDSFSLTFKRGEAIEQAEVDYAVHIDMNAFDQDN